MSRRSLIICVVGTALFSCQQPACSADEDLAKRVAELEQRVEALEQLLAAHLPQPPHIPGAEAKVAAAEQRLAYSERLFRKGYITQLQLDADRWAARIARRELELEKSGKNDALKALEIGVMVAEQELAAARERLEYSERLLKRGFITEIQVNSDKFTVEQARLKLERAKGVLKNSQDKVLKDTLRSR